MSERYIALAAPGVQQLTPYTPGKPIEELERELGIRNSIKLASNENPLGPSPKAKAAAEAALGKMHLYPDAAGFALRAKLAQRHGVNDNQITLGNGSNDVLDIIARTFLSPGYNAVFSEYAFIVYAISTRAVGADARVAAANPRDHKMPLGHSLSNLLEQINDQTRVVFIANPNNPTGTWLSSIELRAFMTEVPDNVMVVMDEAYGEYVDNADFPDTTAWVAEFPNLIVTRTFSKAFGLAGLRVGYSVSNDVVAGLLNRVRQPFNTSVVAQAAAMAALDDTDYLKRSAELNRQQMAVLEKAVADMGLSSLPSVGNFLAVDFGRDAMPIYQALLKEGVITRPVANYGMNNYLRISIGTEAEMARLIESLRKVLA